MRYGFIGLGHLGQHLAGSLVREGFKVAVHDRDRAAAEPLLKAGAAWAASPAEAAKDADGLITCLPSPKVSEAVITAALEGFKPGATWIEMSTVDEDTLARLSAPLKARKVDVLACPVTGGVHRAAAGAITVLVGGDQAVFEKHRGALGAMGGEVIHLGGHAQASVTKVVTNMLAFIHLIAAGEALMLCKKGGVDLGQAFRAIKASSGNSFVHETESQVILNGSYDIGFTMDLACKDAGFALEMGRRFGVPLKLAGLMEQTFVEGRAKYGGGAWSSMIVKLLEDSVGEDLRAPGFPAQLAPE
jgi:3-hydroxyisobutyrate dehydrogenase